jgi:hypothetical protein
MESSTPDWARELPPSTDAYASIQTSAHFFESATVSWMIGRDIMRTRSFHSELRAEDLEGDALVERPEAGRKQYARGRSARTPRRRSSRSAGANIPLGISARRNRRWAW